tara:strand:- start:4523 stop:4804 length:282 start_codon:yes stop_codon:yes gene_type:complete
MKITKRQLKRIIKEATNLLKEQNDGDWLSDLGMTYPDEVAEHGPVVNAYYPGGNISRMVVEFEDGHEVTQGDPDEPDRYPSRGSYSGYGRSRW